VRDTLEGGTLLCTVLSAKGFDLLGKSAPGYEKSIGIKSGSLLQRSSRKDSTKAPERQQLRLRTWRGHSCGGYGSQAPGRVTAAALSACRHRVAQVRILATREQPAFHFRPRLPNQSRLVTSYLAGGLR
jgi:hypothetical protein